MKAGKRNIKVLTGFLVLFGLLVFCKSAMANNLEPNLPPDPKIIVQEIRRLSTTDRGWLIAVKRLRSAGEYAIPYMLDAMADDSRKEELVNIIKALPEIGRDSIRPLAAALQTKDVAIKAEIIKALGKIGYPQSLPYLKYIVEKDDSAELRSLAEQSIRQIDPVALTVPATDLFYRLGEKYSSHAKSLAPAINAEFANIWFCDSVNERLERKEVDRNHFYELMAERACKWAMKADPRMVDKLQIPSENNTKVQDEKISNEPNCTDLKVFGIPLNASLQEVVDVLEKNEINVQGWLISKKRFAEIVSNGITQSYDEYNMSSTSKERALRLLQEGKIKSFDVEYEGKNLVAEPTGLMRLLGIKHPVFEKHYDIYNTQVVLQCGNLPNYMLAQGIRHMHIFFASFNQGTPKSYLISLRFYIPYGAEKKDVVYNALVNKYGIPKMYYNRTSGRRYSFISNDMYAFDQLENAFLHPVRKPKGVLYPKAWEVLSAVIRNPFRDSFPYFPHDIHGFSKNYDNARFTLEWVCDDIKILYGAKLCWSYTSVEYDELVVYDELDTLNYIHWPTIERLHVLYEKLSDTSEKAEAKMIEKGKKGF